jgi:hypothetical protein
MQASLSRKREALEAVVDRMNDLKEIGIKENEELSEVEEDILGPILEDLEKKGYKFPSETQTSTYTDGTQVESISEEGRSQDGTDLSAKEEDEPTQQATEPSHPPTKTTQTIRPRNHASSVPQKPTQPDQALSTTTTSSDAARAVLFRKSKARATTQATTATAEALQDRQRREQESIVEDILRVASGLRANAHRFADHLEKDKLSVQKAGDAMDTAETGMETAGRKMIGLKRITEGEGWWGRMILYAWIFGLMVLLVVVVFVLPKFRL